MLATGHNHPHVVKAVTEQAAQTLNPCMPVVNHDNYARVAETLNAHAPGDFRKDFVSLLRTRPVDASARLSAWIEQACASTVVELERFASGIQKDTAAVLGAITSPWSNGQVEGQVTRVKLLKRQMYGRAKFDLLRARILLA